MTTFATDLTSSRPKVSARRAVIYRMATAEHICPFGLKALDLLKRRPIWGLTLSSPAADLPVAAEKMQDRSTSRLEQISSTPINSDLLSSATEHVSA